MQTYVSIRLSIRRVKFEAANSQLEPTVYRAGRDARMSLLATPRLKSTLTVQFILWQV